MICLLSYEIKDKWNTSECSIWIDRKCEEANPRWDEELVQYCAFREDVAKDRIVASWMAIVVIVLCAIVIGIAGLLAWKDRKTTDVMAVYENHP